MAAGKVLSSISADMAGEKAIVDRAILPKPESAFARVLKADLKLGLATAAAVTLQEVLDVNNLLPSVNATLPVLLSSCCNLLVALLCA